MRERSTLSSWNLPGQRGCRLRFGVVPFFGEFVLDLLQEPILTRSVSHSAFYDRPFSPKFRAIQGESHDAVAERGRRVGSFRSDHRILAEVPYDDFARPVLTFRKGFLEQKVGERVVRHMDGEALYLRIFAWPLRHRPGDEGRPNFQSEVIVGDSLPSVSGLRTGVAELQFEEPLRGRLANPFRRTGGPSGFCVTRLFPLQRKRVSICSVFRPLGGGLVAFFRLFRLMASESPDRKASDEPNRS